MLSGNSKFLAMLFSSLGAGGVATIGGLAATGNLYNALKILLEGAEGGGGGERVSRRLTQHVDTTADQILAKLSATQQVRARNGRPTAELRPNPTRPNEPPRRDRDRPPPPPPPLYPSIPHPRPPSRL